MNKFLSKRVLALAATVVATIVAPLAAMASFSPDRPTFPYNPTAPGADHVVFNSFVGTPYYGDERYFLDGKDAANTQNGGFQDVMQVTGGEEVMLRVYIHNNADPSKNADGSGIATNTRVHVELPTAAGNTLRTNAYITADNASPKTISDTLDMQNSSLPFSVSYVPGSAKLYNTHFQNGVTLSDDIVKTSGALVGSDALDGKWKACFEYQGFVYLKVKINQPKVTFQKFVHLPNDTNRLTELSGLKSGDTVEWVLSYKNETAQPINNVYVRDQLPAHVTVVPGTVKQYDSNYPNGYARTDQGIFTGTGINIGTVGPNANGSIRFQTKVNDDLVCGNTPMTNNAWLRADNLPEEGSHAQINASKTCVTTCTQNCTPPCGTPGAPGCGGSTPPPALPQTGAEGAAAGVLGSGALGYSLRAYLRSKRSLLAALKR